MYQTHHHYNTSTDVLRRNTPDAASPPSAPPLFAEQPTSPPQFVFGSTEAARPLHEFATRPVCKSPAGVRRSHASPKRPFARGAPATAPSPPTSSGASTGFWTPGSTNSTATAEPAAMAARFERVVHVSEATGTVFTASTPASRRRTPATRRSPFKPKSAATPMDYSPMDVSPLPTTAPTPPPFSFAAASPTAATPVAFGARADADLPAALQERLLLDGQGAASPMVFGAAAPGTRAARTARAKHRQSARRAAAPPSVALHPPDGYQASMQRAAEDLQAQRRAAAAQRAEVLHQEGNALYKARRYDAAAAQFMQGVAALEGLEGADARRLQLLTNCAACRIMLRQPEQAVALSLQALQVRCLECALYCSSSHIIRHASHSVSRPTAALHAGAPRVTSCSAAWRRPAPCSPPCPPHAAAAQRCTQRSTRPCASFKRRVG